MRIGSIPNPVWALGTVPTNHFGWFFPWSQVVSAHAWANQYSAKYSRGTLCTSLKFSFCAALFSLALCPVVSILLLFSESQLCFLNSGSLLGSTLVPFPASWLENSLKAVSWVIVIIGLILSFSFSGFTVFHCLVSSVLNCCFIYCPLLAALGKGVDLATITLSWQEVKGRSPLLPPPLASS